MHPSTALFDLSGGDYINTTILFEHPYDQFTGFGDVIGGLFSFYDMSYGLPNSYSFKRDLAEVDWVYNNYTRSLDFIYETVPGIVFPYHI